jgi:hypothetical protein
MEQYTNEYFEKEQKRQKEDLELKATMEQWTNEYFENEEKRLQEDLKLKALMEEYTNQYFKEELKKTEAFQDARYALMQDGFNAIQSISSSAAQLALNILDNRFNAELAKIDAFAKVRIQFAKGNEEEILRINQEAEERKFAIQEEYMEKARRVELAAIIAEKALAIAQVIISTMIANAKARAFSPITLGQPWVNLNRIQAALSIAAITAAAAAAVVGATGGKKFAKGGWTGDGTQKDETGERVAGVVHEKEFVVKRGQASKYREVLEAINRDDRKAIYNNFTKLEPEFASVNNVTVENSGPNNRLDRINSQLYQLNRTMTPKKIQREEMMVSGSTVVIRKGNSVRVIKR